MNQISITNLQSSFYIFGCTLKTKYRNLAIIISFPLASNNWTPPNHLIFEVLIFISLLAKFRHLKNCWIEFPPIKKSVKIGGKIPPEIYLFENLTIIPLNIWLYIHTPCIFTSRIHHKNTFIPTLRLAKMLCTWIECKLLDKDLNETSPTIVVLCDGSKTQFSNLKVGKMVANLKELIANANFLVWKTEIPHNWP